MRVRAFGSGAGYTDAWSAPSATLATATSACPPPTFGETAYSFSVAEDSATGAAVGTVSATTTGAGPVTLRADGGPRYGGLRYRRQQRGPDGGGGAGLRDDRQLRLDRHGQRSRGRDVDGHGDRDGDGDGRGRGAGVRGGRLCLFTVAEDAAVGAAVGRVSATDPEGGAVTYAITAGNDTGAFALDAGTGALTVAAALDYETADAYTLTVTASDAQGHTATADIAVTVTDVAYPPGFGATSYAWSVAEDAAVGAALGTVGATDPEGGAVSYAITAGNDGGGTSPSTPAAAR